MREAEDFNQKTSIKSGITRIKDIIVDVAYRVAQRVSIWSQFARKQSITMVFEIRLRELLTSESYTLVEKIYHINQMIWELERLLEWVQHKTMKRDIEDFIAKLKIQSQQLKRSEQLMEFNLSIEWKIIARNALTRERLWDQLSRDIDQLIDIFVNKRSAYSNQISKIQEILSRIKVEKQEEKNYWRKVFLENIEWLLKENLEVISFQSGISIEKASDLIQVTPTKIQEGIPWQTRNPNKSSRLLNKSIQDELRIVMEFADNPNELIHDKSMKLLWLKKRLLLFLDGDGDGDQWVIYPAIKMVQEKKASLQRSSIDDDQLATLRIENRTPNISSKEFDALRFTRIEREWKVYLWKLQRLLAMNPDLTKRLSDYFLSSTLSEALSVKLNQVV